MMRHLLVAFLLTLSAAHAAVLNVTISPSPLTGNPGQMLTFSGTLENTTGDEVFINSNSFTFDISGTGVLDDSLFLSNAPFTLLSLESSTPFDFLSVNIPALQGAGLYSGVFTVLGGADELAMDVLGTASFAVEVSAASADIPEPATVLLMGGGLALLFWRRRR